MMLPRSARFNVVAATAAKIVSMGTAVFTVPLLLGLLGKQDYGTWVTLTSLVAFISLLDLGVGNSLRNAVASAGNHMKPELHAEITSFFQLLAGIGLLALLAFGFTVQGWSLMSSHPLAATLLYAPLLLTLPLLLGGAILQGAKATGLQAILQTAGSFLFFVLVGLFAWTNYVPSLNQLAIGWSSFYVLSLVVVFVLALRTLKMSPRSLLTVSFAHLPKGRLVVGFEFLLLQLAGLVVFSLGNILIFQNLGPEEVARYDVLNKVFQVALSFFNITIGVMWTEIAGYRAEHNVEALKRIFKRLAMIAVAFSGVALAGSGLAPWLIDVWTGHRLHVSVFEAFSMALLVTIQALAYVGAVFMNAFEKIRIQVLMACVSIALMIPTSSMFFTYGLGIAAVPLAAASLTLVAVLVCNFYAVNLVRGVRRQEARS